MILLSLILADLAQEQISFFTNINHLLFKMIITCSDQIFMMDLYVSLAEVHFIPISCNTQISLFIRLINYTTTFQMPTLILLKLGLPVSLFNIFFQVFNSIRMQWKAQFKENTQWKSFKNFRLKPLESNF